MLKLKVRLPNSTEIEASTDKGRLRFRYGRKPAAKPPAATVVERTAVLVVPVPVVKTVYLAQPPAPSAEDIAYAILQELDSLERLRRDLQQPEEEVLNGQPRKHRSYVPGPAFYVGQPCTDCHTHQWQGREPRCPVCGRRPPWDAAILQGQQ